MEKKFYLCKGYKANIIKDKSLIFYHLPKSGGTTFCNLFSYLFKKNMRIWGSFDGERNTNSAYNYFIKNKKNILLSKTDFIYGHIPYKLSYHFNNRISATLIRNPLERIISHYNMIIDRELIDKKTDIENCFRNKIIPNNVTTKQFCGEWKDNLILNERLYKKAIINLSEKIDYVYDTNNSHELFNLIISIYNLPNLFFQNYQITKKNYFIENKKNFEAIKNYNNYDIRLYKYLKKNNIFTKINKKKKSRDNQLFFYLSPYLLLNKKQNYLLTQDNFLKIMEDIQNKKYIIKEY